MDNPGSPSSSPVPDDGEEVPIEVDRKSGKRRSLVLALACVASLLVVVAAISIGWFWYQLDPPGAPGATRQVEIVEGSGNEAIGKELARRDVIGSAFAFRLYARYSQAGPFLAGRFKLRERMGVRSAVAALEEVPELSYTQLALPPGLTIPVIASRVGEVPGLDAQKFLDAANSGVIRSRFQPPDVTSLEGLTWPDTYYVTEYETEEDLLRTLVATFDKRAAKAGLLDAPDPYRAVIIASLIQTEARLDEDRPLISAVVENRLRDAMPLQIDATLLYARGFREGPLTDADFTRDSPYNTYSVKGLPPTPISTVSAASLEAAQHPAAVTFRFYVLIDPSGKHRFADTYAEHERNVAQARALGLLG